ncbi:MAG TPA: hypothetical protein VIG97_12985 [Luteimonas sp.]
MSRITTLLAAGVVAPLALLCAGTADARQSGHPMAQRGAQMAFMAGSMHGAAEVCGGYSTDKLESMQRDQKGAALQMGMSAADYDAKFKEGYEKGRTAVETASPAEREQSCSQLQSMGMTGR